MRPSVFNRGAVGTAQREGAKAVAPLPGQGLRTRIHGLVSDFSIVLPLLTIEAVLIALFLLDQTLSLGSSLLDMGAEHNLVTWFSSMQFAGAGLAAAALSHMRRDWRCWGVVAAVMMLFSLDEVAQLHERVEYLARSYGDEGQTIVGALELAGAVVILALAARIGRRLVPAERVLLVAAAVSLVGAQIASAVDAAGVSPWLAPGVTATEETLEMLVGTLIIAAAAPVLLTRARRLP